MQQKIYPSSRVSFKAIDISTQNAYEYVVDKGTIIAISPINKCNEYPFLSPGLVDVQVNGCLGIDYSSEDLDAKGIEKICLNLARKGTLQHFPTIVTRPEKTIERNLSLIATTVHENETIASEITGIHIEGPYISPLDGPRGAHDKRYVRNPSIQELDRWIDCSNGLLKVITLAPELEGALDFIRYATQRNIVCSLGHCQPTGEQVDQAVLAGATICTHLGNGIANMLNRFENPIISQLANEQLAISMILDGCHLLPRTVKVFSLCKNEDDIVIITDLAPMAGLPEGIVNWGDVRVKICEDGCVRLVDQPYLAGAGSPLIKNIGNYVKFTGKSLALAVKACTTNPTRIYHLDNERMWPKIGQKANFLLFNWDKENYNATLQTVYQNGIPVVNQ